MYAPPPPPTRPLPRRVAPRPPPKLRSRVGGADGYNRGYGMDPFLGGAMGFMGGMLIADALWY